MSRFIRSISATIAAPSDDTVAQPPLGLIVAAVAIGMLVSTLL